MLKYDKLFFKKKIMGLNNKDLKEDLENQEIQKSENNQNTENTFANYFSTKIKNIFTKPDSFKEMVFRTLEDEEIKKLLIKYPNILEKMKKCRMREDVLLRVDSREKIDIPVGCLKFEEINEILYDSEICSEIRFFILKKMYHLAIHENLMDIFRKIEGENIEKEILTYEVRKKVKYIYDKKEKVCLVSFSDRLMVFKNLEEKPKKISDEKYEIGGKFFNHVGNEL